MYRECVNDCDACIKVKPNFAKALRRKALALINLLKFSEAILASKAAYDITKEIGIKN